MRKLFLFRMSKKSRQHQQTGAELLVRCLKEQGVEYVFGIPGAAIMPILEVLRRDQYKKGIPQFIVCRHEQNAVFMAQAIGRLTGKPGVCLVTAGPGATNIVTGVATATADRDPVVAITGSNPITQHTKKAHQNIHTRDLFSSVSKRSIEVEDVNSIPEIVALAFTVAQSQRKGATHLTLPLDIQEMTTFQEPLPYKEELLPSIAQSEYIKKAVARINSCRQAVLLLGVGATENGEVTGAVRRFIQKIKMPTVGTFEAAGAVSRALAPYFLGRVGLKAREPGDIALEQADVVIAVGYDPIEYNPSYWNKKKNCTIIHVDTLPADPDHAYRPDIELVGSIAQNLDLLCGKTTKSFSRMHPKIRVAQKKLLSEQERGRTFNGSPIHPLRFIYDLRKCLDDAATIISDVGSHQVWLAKYFFSFEPKHLLFSMGFQTMGVALPWAMATTLVRPNSRVVSISGDGSFLMSATELETAVRQKMSFTHIVWRSEGYNLVEIQQLQAYGKGFGVTFGNPDIVKFAESFGATAFRIDDPSQIIPTLKNSFSVSGPVVVDVPIDYRDNLSLLNPKELIAFK